MDAQQLGDKPSFERCATLAAQVKASSGSSFAIDEARAVGLSAARTGAYDCVAALFSAILEFRPSDAEALYYRALALFNLRRVTEAEPVARAAVAAVVSNGAASNSGLRDETAASDPLVLLGTILAVEGKNKEAVAAVKQAVRLSPGNFDAQFALGRALYGTGDLAAAGEAFRKATEIRPSDVRARFFLASALEREGDTALALSAYRRLILIAPGSAEGHLGLGALLARLDEEGLPEAISELKRATDLDPGLYEAWLALGRALIRSGQPALAIQHLKKAAELAPRNPEPHYQLALALRLLGRKEESAREFAIVEGLNERHRRTSESTNRVP